MSNTHSDVDIYLRRVRDALADLPSAERDEVLEDVSAHLAEVAAELGDPVTMERLVERLGEPERCAAELRAAAGYPEPTVAKKSSPATPRLALWSLVAATVFAGFGGFLLITRDRDDEMRALALAAVCALVSFLLVRTQEQRAALADLPEMRRVWSLYHRFRTSRNRNVDFVRSLQPAWWVLRAVAMALALGLVLGLGTIGMELAPFLVLGAFLAVGSVWLGRRGQADRRLLWLVLPGNALAVGVLLVAGAELQLGGAPVVPAAVSYSHVPPDALRYGDRQTTNLYAFDGEGRPIEEFYLYDEEGNPIRIVRTRCYEGERLFLDDMDNRFPRPRVEYDASGRCVEREGIPFTVVIPKNTSGTTPSSSGTPGTSAPSTTDLAAPESSAQTAPETTSTGEEAPATR
ncbi:MAG TPA: hypothetical protein VIL00_02175 [Pseudonocardiaceae bacterium]